MNNNGWLSLENWLHGLASAFIGGGATAVTVIVIDPVQFNIHEGLKNLMIAFLVSGIINAAAYLKKSPLPGDSSDKQG